MLGFFNCLPSKPKKPGFSLQNSLPIIPRTSEGIPRGKVLGDHDNLANNTVMKVIMSTILWSKGYAKPRAPGKLASEHGDLGLVI